MTAELLAIWATLNLRQQQEALEGLRTQFVVDRDLVFKHAMKLASED